MLFLLAAVASAFDYGIVNLDNYTMPLLIGKGVPADETLEYSSMDKYFPKFILFPKEKGAAEVPYTGATDNKDNLKSGLMSLMKRHANIYFGLPGCIQELDTIAATFKADAGKALTEAKA